MILYIKSEQKLLLLNLKDEDGTLITDATVVASVLDRDNNPIVSNVTLTWNAAKTRYEYQIAAANFNPVPGLYKAVFDITVDGNLVKHKEPDVTIQVDK